MRNSSSSESGIFGARAIAAFLLCAAGVSLALFSFAAPTPGTPTFGHPTISGIGGVGFEQNLRIDPSNPNRVYTSAPGTLSSDLSWIWRSLDAGKTFKWVPNAAALQGKVTTCNGGGDTELAVDSAGHLYFNDLTLANFSTARSDDQGATFTCSNTGVPDTAVDRQWYAIDGDPTNGGAIYLANDEIGPGGAMCGSSTGNNVLVMYRSPVGGAGATAGIEFGPRNAVTPDLSCDEGIMGNNEVSPVATTLGQPELTGGFATLAAAVKHIFVIHDDAAFQKIRVGRCFPVAFGPPIPNVSDPSGLNCTDIVIADLGTNAKTGGSFPTMAIDKAGNLYAVWEQAPIDGSGKITGDTVLKYSYSTDQGNSWSALTEIDTSGSPAGVLHTNVFAWIAAGDDGRVDIAWYGTPGAPTFPSNGPDSCGATCDWSLWMTQSLNAHAATPTFATPVQASEHFIHRGSIQTVMGGQNGDRTLGDFLQLRIGALGEAEISYADSNNIDEPFAPHGMFVRQNGGEGLFVSSSPVAIDGLAPANAVTDPSGDGKYEVNGTSSASMPQLDILGSSIAKVTTAPCSDAAPCYQVTMQLNDLSLAPTTSEDPDTDLVWLTQWLVPSATDVAGGKNFFVYAESTGGGALQCFAGENAALVTGGGLTLTYPGATTLPADNCQSTPGANGTITIYVPLSAVSEKDPIDNRLHEVTASTMTLPNPANSDPSFAGLGGSLFNLIDVAQGYTFEPADASTPTPTPSPTPTGTPTPTPTASPTPANVQLLNISGRVSTQTGDKVGIGGFIISGANPKRVIIRGLGPSLSSGGQPIPGTLEDPILELHDSNGRTIGLNDNWRTSQESEIQQTGLAPANDRESAIVTTLAPSNYTAIIRGFHNEGSIGLIEVFDLAATTSGELGNLSVRADVRTNDNVLIDGLILQGGDPKRVVFRAIGPSLRTLGVQGELADPTLELHDVNGVLLGVNDNWKDGANAAEIQAAGLAPSDDRESALLMTLTAGNYTTIVRGVNGTTGIGLAEAFKLQN